MAKPRRRPAARGRGDDAPKAGARGPAKDRARLSVHLILGVLTIASAGIFYAVAGTTAGFVGWFMVAQVVAGAALAHWGISRLRSADPPPSRLDQLHPARFFLETWREMDEEARALRAERRAAGLGYDYRPLVALCVGAVCLSLMEYFGGSRTLDSLLEWVAHTEGGAAALDDLTRSQAAAALSLADDPEALMVAVRRWPWYRLCGFAWWSGWRVLGYFVIPVLAVKAMRQRVRDQGLETKGFSEHAWIYALAFGIVFVCVVIVSYTEEFSTYYPFYKGASRSWFDFGTWELLYAAQFLSLEFFFRGFWLKALKPMMGSHAIFAMVVPYCMIHFGKPFPETLAAIVAGLVLGTLSMKTRSIWSGFLIHVSVAVSMDVAALLRTTGLPDVWFPDF